MDDGEVRIGDWVFDSEGAELRRAEERRRLEHRAARTLELLLSRRGQVVSHADIVAHVWNGRHLSANSIPVVIRDLRRALDDDARSPRFIETVAKRGYRLVSASDSSTPAVIAEGRDPKRTLWLVLAAIVMIGAALGSAWLWWSPKPGGAPVAVHDVVNATGDPAYDPLARSVSELVSLNLARAEGVSITRNPAPGSRGDRGVRLTAKLVLWTGKPTVMFSADDRKTGKLVWSGMAGGPEPRFPVTVAGTMDHFAKVAAEQDAAPK